MCKQMCDKLEMFGSIDAQQGIPLRMYLQVPRALLSIACFVMKSAYRGFAAQLTHTG